ncbi:hypothetical protein BDD12DRAFT_879470 [Trichophaea hybrida]|nr:hypothetical protein BDD12DRAFT_879470 [Trichophaea hybrida]
MAPSLNLFSRRKNSGDISPSSVKSSDSSAPTKLVKHSRSKESSPTFPTGGLVYVPRIRTRAATYGREDTLTPGHVRSNSDTWKMQNRGAGGPLDFRPGGMASLVDNDASPPLPPAPSPPPQQKIYQPAPIRTQRFRHHQPQLSISSEFEDLALRVAGSNSEPPTPVITGLTPTSAPISAVTPTSAPISAVEPARKREFRFPLPISPPLSPESPIAARGYSPMHMEVSALPDEHMGRFPPQMQTGLSPIFPPLSASSVDSNNDFIHPPAMQQLLQRVQELENRNRELSSEATLHSSRIDALRQSHSSAIDSLKEAHVIELDALRKSSWPVVVKGKEKELELLRSNNDGFKARIQILEQRLKERDEELDWVKEKIRALETERTKEEKEVAVMDIPEVGRRLLDEIRRRKAAEQSNDELVAMVTKINIRLADEKRKNKRLESSMTQITEEAWLKVSDSKHDIQKLKNALEDKDTLVAGLQVEVTAAKRERKEFEEAWKREQSENSARQQTIEDREERIKDLEFESGELRDSLELSQAEFEQLQKQSEVHEDILVKLVENSSSSSRCSSTRDGAACSSDEHAEDLHHTVEKLRRDIKLYRSDIRAYRRDVKSRDKTINQLQSQLSSPVTPRDGLLQEFPQPPTSKLCEENESLRQEIAGRVAVAKQQVLVLKDMEEKMKLLRLEKEQLEMKQFRGIKLKLEQYKSSAGTGGEDGIIRLRKSPSGRKKKDVGDLESPRSPPPTSPLPPPPPPRKDGGPEEEGQTFVW